jgi:Fe2+ transport system protein B
MFSDPIFLLSLLAVFGLIGVWVYQVLQETLTEQSQQIIYITGLTASLIGIYRIFVNAGDLGSGFTDWLSYMFNYFVGGYIQQKCFTENNRKRMVYSGISNFYSAYFHL